ncbi:hypothetical protein G6L97_26255 (plasmid) [Agrobacterium tumefaciens]|uniref:hypothetical protein n=1 Tax=Agrobacterium tumefaciens TaxID=358 RepID=UPI00157448B7|nr:hypothetical protein [Agrobacterium tumefaciens]NSZ87632.1 hypothetical protein [Agrobacterium tumefaciens]WCA72958.1 hypothetical protein G6L97_26255 [Agrobacterium tumefaciens]
MAKKDEKIETAPVYYRGRRKTLKIDAAMLIDIFKMCSENGQLDELQNLLVERKSVISVEAELANEVKRLFFEKELHTRSVLAASITGYRDPSCPDPYHCQHVRR